MLLHSRIAAELGRRRDDRDLAAEEKGRPVAEAEGLRHVMISQDDRGASVGQGTERRPRPRRALRIDGREGLVAEEHPRRGRKRTGELEPAALPPRERGGVRLTHGDGWITAERAGIDIATAKVTMSDVKGSIPVPKPAP